MIPQTFRDRYAPIAGDAEAFFSCLEKQPPFSFRVNTLKADTGEVQRRFERYGISIRTVPWCEGAFVADQPVSATIEHALGMIYIQDLASMLPARILHRAAPGGTILDMCAAPGSKTTQLAALMANRGSVVANDADPRRIRALISNIEKAGALNTIVTRYDGRHFPDAQFDAVLLDAPCSSEGTRPLKNWIPDYRRKSLLQKKLILRAFDLLVPGGFLVYSTCTFAPEENEAVVNSLLRERDARIEPIAITAPRASGLAEWKGTRFDDSLRDTIRLWPHLNDTDGFYIALVST